MGRGRTALRRGCGSAGSSPRRLAETGGPDPSAERRARRGSPERVGLRRGGAGGEFLRAGVRGDRRRRARSTAVLSVLLRSPRWSRPGWPPCNGRPPTRANGVGRRPLADQPGRSGARAAIRAPRCGWPRRHSSCPRARRPGSALAQLVRDTRYAGTLDGHTNTLSACGLSPRTGAPWPPRAGITPCCCGTCPRGRAAPARRATAPRQRRHRAGLHAGRPHTGHQHREQRLATGPGAADPLGRQQPGPAVWIPGEGRPPGRSCAGAASLAATPDGRTGGRWQRRRGAAVGPQRPGPAGAAGRRAGVRTFFLQRVRRVRLSVSPRTAAGWPWPTGTPTAVGPERPATAAEARRPAGPGPRASGRGCALAFSPDGRALAAADADDSATAHLVLWDLGLPRVVRSRSDPRCCRPAGPGRRWPSPPTGAGWPSAAQVASTEVWDVTDPDPTGPHRRPVERAQRAGGGAGLRPGRPHPASRRPTTTRRCSGTSPEPYQVRRVATLPGSATAVSADGRLLAGAGVPDLVATLWDVTDPARPPTLSRFPAGPDLPPGDSEFSSVAVAPDGGLLASYTSDPDHGTVILWDVRDPHPSPAAGPAPPTAPVPCTGWCSPRTSRCWRWPLRTAWPCSTSLTRPGRLLTTTVPTGDFLKHSVEFDPTGRTLLTTGPGASGLVRWDLSEPAAPRARGEPLIGSTELRGRRRVRPGRRHSGDRQRRRQHRALGPRRRRSVAAGRAAAARAGPADDAVGGLRRRRPHAGRRRAGPDRAVGPDRTAHPRQLGVPFAGHGNTIGSMRLLPDGRTLAVVGPGDKSTGLWDLSPVLAERDQALALACWRTGDGLDRAEWARFVPDLDYEDSCADAG